MRMAGPVRMVARGVKLVMAVLVAAAAAAPPSKVKSQEDVMEALASIEERVRSLENVWHSLDRRLQQDANKIDSLHIKLDRLEGLMSGRAHQAQLAADRAANTCQHLQNKINMQQVGETIRGGRSAAREAPAGAEATQRGDCHHKKEEMQSEGRRQTMQQDMSSNFNKESMQVSNMYKDLWRRSLVLEGMVKDSMTLTNATRRETHDGYRSLMLQLRRSCASTPNQYNLDQMKEHLINFVQRKISESDHKMENKFQEVILAQKDFSESCHRIQLNEQQLETEVTRVLEKLFDTLMNKTATTNKELQTLQDLMKSHDVRIIKAVARVSSATVTSGKEFKGLANTITEKCRYQDEMPGRFIELASFGRKLDTLLTFLQELQEEMTYNENRKIETMTKTLGSKIVLNEISKEIHKAVKNVSESVICPKPDNVERDSLVEKLTTLVENLQDLTVQLEEKEDGYNENLADDDMERSLNLAHKSISNITTPKELIDKLKNINFEKSPEIITNESIEYEEDMIRRKSTIRKEVKRKENVIHRNEDDPIENLSGKIKKHNAQDHRLKNYNKHEKDVEQEWNKYINPDDDDVYYKSSEFNVEDYDDELFESTEH